MVYLITALPLAVILGTLLHYCGADLGITSSLGKALMWIVNSVVGLLIISIILLMVDMRRTGMVRIDKGYTIYSTEPSGKHFILQSRNDTSADHDGSREYFFYRKKNGGYYTVSTDVSKTFIKQSKDNTAHLEIAFEVYVSRFGIYPAQSSGVAYYTIYLPKEYVIK